MKTKDELSKLNNAIYDAIFDYRNAIEGNLKESGGKARTALSFA